MNVLPQPPRPQGTTAEQVQALYRYLFLLIAQLNREDCDGN